MGMASRGGAAPPDVGQRLHGVAGAGEGLRDGAHLRVARHRLCGQQVDDGEAELVEFVALVALQAEQSQADSGNICI